MRVIAASVLSFEAIIVVLAIPVAIALGRGRSCSRSCRRWRACGSVHRRCRHRSVDRGGMRAGWVVQALILVSGFVVTAMFIVGGLFVALWWIGLLRRTPRRTAPRGTLGE